MSITHGTVCRMKKSIWFNFKVEGRLDYMAVIILTAKKQSFVLLFISLSFLGLST